MKIRKYQWLLAMILFAVAFSLSGCSKDDPSGDEDEGDGTEIETNTTATTEVKEMVIKQSGDINWSTDYLDLDGFNKYFKCYWIYEDFNYTYCFILRGNELWFAPLTRSGVSFRSAFEKGKSYISGFELDDKVDGILSIIEKLQLNRNYVVYQDVQPYKGYKGVFKTYDKGDKNIRVFIKGYKLDKDSKLESIAIQYQLY